MFLITNGDINVKTPAIVVEREDELDYYIEQFHRNTGVDRDQIVVNKVGERIR